MNLRLAYSYIRFSSPEQAKGDSKRRQWEACEAFCRDNSLCLETSRRFYDEGKSGFKGKHRTEGALGKFLELIEAGHVPVGSVLIVEAFDRLSREDTLTAFTMFTSILKAGVDLVTLVDRQWYSRETINQNMGQLMLSIGALWSANNYSVLLSRRLGNAWEQKQKKAREEMKPMTRICPGWLCISEDQQRFEVIPERVKVIRLIFWLTLRGWGKQRIAKLFNRHLNKLPTWGVKGKKADAWHYSYIQKILTNRAVLGEFVPHSSRSGGKRLPLGAIRGYYPAIIDETVFLRLQNSRPGPKGPLGKSVANLFQGLLRDGEHPEFSMWYKDHGDAAGKWIYVISDNRRVHPDAPLFSWQYPALERLVLNYLVDMDWSSLTAGQDTEVRRLRQDLEGKEAHQAELGRQIKRLLEVVKIAGQIEETARELGELEQRRSILKSEIKVIRASIEAKSDFSTEDAAELVRRLAAERTKPESRLRLRDAIRAQVERIELFRTFPSRLLEGLQLPSPKGVKLEELLHARCVRILFRNGAERWLVDRRDAECRAVLLDRNKVPPVTHLTLERDQFGGQTITDIRESKEIRGKPIKKNEEVRTRRKNRKKP